MPVFRWLHACGLPAGYDLRRRGWTLKSGSGPDADTVALADVAQLRGPAWPVFLAQHRHDVRRLIVLLGVYAPESRAQLLRLGFGEVLSGTCALDEIDVRATRLIELEHMLPRFRTVGPMRLDLLAREAFVDGVPIGLHPREFGLLWRLAREPGTPLTKRRLMEDVWHLRFVPETNSLAVHVSRLRAKLRLFGIDALLQTTRAGSYVLASSGPSAGPAAGHAVDAPGYARTGATD